MITISVINELKSLVSKMTEGISDLSFTESEYRDEMTRFFEAETDRINCDLNRDFILATQEQCDKAKANFKYNMHLVQKHLRDLHQMLEKVKAYNTDETWIIEAQMEFCQKLNCYIRHLIEQTTQMSNELLTDEEYSNTFFMSLKQKNDILPEIYKGLVENYWIDGDYSSEADFLYYFGGNGIHPLHRIRWQESLPFLASFLELMTSDVKYVAKSWHIFEVPKGSGYERISPNSLKASKYRSIESEAETFWEYQKKIVKKIPQMSAPSFLTH